MSLRQVRYNKEERNRRQDAYRKGRSLGPTLLQKYLLKLAWDNGGSLPADTGLDKRCHNWLIRQCLLEQQGEKLVLTQHGWDTAAECVGNVHITPS